MLDFAPKPTEVSAANVRRRVLLAVTAAQSFRLLTGFPDYLAEHDWDVHVVTGEPTPSPFGSKVRVHTVPMRRDPAPIRDLVALASWVRLLRRVRPDVVVAGTPKAGLVGTVAAALCRVPVRIYMLRGLRASSELGLKQRVLLAMEWTAAKCSTQVLAVSHSLGAEFAAKGLAPKTKIVVLGSGSSNGVEIPDLGRVQRASVEGIRGNLPVVGFVGRVCADKGVGVLVKAFQMLIAEGMRAQLLLIGPEEPAGYLDGILGAQGGDRELYVRTGAVGEPAGYYPLLDILCLPTKREGFPNVVLEAAVAGVPTVASRVTGCVDAVVDGVTGWLVEPGDPAALADSLRRFMTDPAGARAMGQAARRRAGAEFSREAVWSRTECHLRYVESRSASTTKE